MGLIYTLNDQPITELQIVNSAKAVLNLVEKKAVGTWVLDLGAVLKIAQEPIKGGDIVTSRVHGNKRFVIIDPDGNVARVLRQEYWPVPLRMMDAAGQSYDANIVGLTKVGMIDGV